MIENEWVLQYEPWSVYTTLQSNKGEWLVPMINPVNHVMKYVPLWSFQESEIRLLNDPAISEQIPFVQKTLVEGLYKADHDSYCLEQSTQFVKETAGVVPVIMNGRLGRVYIPGYLV
jgi:hypothetical protein